ncbi:acetaldehyde dehydrogenase (acetylating) [Intestinimonas massiliensis]|uniref:Acetaldehyde dehydrogenase n=1 Tax=Intestinimonas massiliensis (ex Afouda et al. 2020) TaxID=1673721 RepID=A0ABS9MA09_9FIRM|nr:acetaldehyde dehydrogenase (acetylating) [Intestinimonas massiliensis (ex Afouda et al. 2020)]MCG4527644.1 acetaldehyde dehydrogenase (acetylating) [Intestinimonas massiliensis (ex Afouda et al. 2020)]MCQ4807486.1 acetaldehyde dehydrogenase (acetylating) [Intestinimonas massiliensis (ex Afouda et al. 2020)]BDE86370.1 acetaldehyde dehydrogenase [Oscillospiraceae bacterium]
MKKAKVAIIGSGNIGMDLMYKVLRNPNLEMSILVGQDVDSPRLQIAADLGIRTSSAGIQAIIDDPDCCDIVFDATTAAVHKMHAPILKQLGKKAIDMTPAGVGALVVPAFNLEENLDADNINLISCGGQAVIPIIGAISRLVPVEYAEAVNASGSKSVGPGTRANVDEYTHHTGDAIRSVGGAKTSKALIVINPADPPIKMHNTIYCILERLDEQLAAKIDKAVHDIVAEIQSYVPGYNMTTPPQFDYERRMVTTMVEIEGAGDYLPKYSGNLDIITQAGVRVAARMAEQM